MCLTAHVIESCPTNNPRSKIITMEKKTKLAKEYMESLALPCLRNATIKELHGDQTNFTRTLTIIQLQVYLI